MQWIVKLMWDFCKALGNAMQGTGVIGLVCAVTILIYRGTNRLIEKEIEKYENQD